MFICCYQNDTLRGQDTWELTGSRKPKDCASIFIAVSWDYIASKRKEFDAIALPLVNLIDGQLITCPQLKEEENTKFPLWLENIVEEIKRKG